MVKNDLIKILPCFAMPKQPQRKLFCFLLFIFELIKLIKIILIGIVCQCCQLEHMAITFSRIADFAKD